MRTAAGLYRRYLLRLFQVADIEDADAAETLLAYGSFNALCAAVHTSSRLLHRHEQQIAVNRDIALAAGTYDGRQVPGLVGFLNAIGIEAVEIADEETIPAECQVGIREVESSAASCLRGRGCSRRRCLS